MTDVRRVSQALQAANQSYRGAEFNLAAYWNHLAAAALDAARPVSSAAGAGAEGDEPRRGART